MAESREEPRRGDGLAAATAISSVDGQRGELRYRGYLVEELAEHSHFVEVCWLLWHGDLPTATELAQLQCSLRAEQTLPARLLAIARILAGAGMEPMAALRTLVSAAALDDLPGRDQDPAVNLRRSLRLTARMPALIAAFERLRKGQEPVAPREDLGHAASFLWMLHGREPAPEAARILDTCLVLHQEHGFNPSTFTARCAASTHTDLYSGLVTAIGTLKGPLHGGANAEVMKTLLEIGEPVRVTEWLDRALADKRRLMGFGHPIYRVPDPRARLLAGLSRRMGELTGEPNWHRITAELEAQVLARRQLLPNVDLYSASIYWGLGIDLDLFPAMFAMARTPGVTAHLLEQMGGKEQLRPEARYVGPAPRRYLPIEQRG